MHKCRFRCTMRNLKKKMLQNVVLKKNEEKKEHRKTEKIIQLEVVENYIITISGWVRYMNNSVKWRMMNRIVDHKQQVYQKNLFHNLIFIETYRISKLFSNLYNRYNV